MIIKDPMGLFLGRRAEGIEFYLYLLSEFIGGSRRKRKQDVSLGLQEEPRESRLRAEK